MILGDEFLAYNILGSSPQSGQHIGILLVEFGVGLTVSNVMIALFNAFASYDEIKRNKWFLQHLVFGITGLVFV